MGIIRTRAPIIGGSEVFVAPSGTADAGEHRLMESREVLGGTPTKLSSEGTYIRLTNLRHSFTQNNLLILYLVLLRVGVSGFGFPNNPPPTNK